METVGTRELKQNPQAVISRVLEAGEPIEVTTYGKPTGVSLVPDEPRPQTWVRGGALKALRPLDDANRLAWKADIAELREDDVLDDLVDPWAGRP
jgi:antitoxin (DNA-binding transcriptional repressor) of toxin-antitoxin stability system